MCDNIIELMPYICTVLMGLVKDPTSGESDSASSGDGIPWWAWIFLGVGVALVATSMAVLTFGVGALAGTMTGAVFHGAATGALVGAGIGAGIGIGSGAIYAGITGSDILSSMLTGGMLGFGIGAIVGAIVGGIHGAIGFARNSAYIMKYGGNVKETLSAFNGNPKLKQVVAGSKVNRYWGGSARQIGRWVTPNTYVNPINSLALNPMWGNTAANVSTLVINQNVTVLVGKVAAQGMLSGGGFQWFIGNLAWLSLL